MIEELMNLKSIVNDNYMAAIIGSITSLVIVWITQRLNNQDQEKYKTDNFFFKDESDYRRIMSWILKESEDVSKNNFDCKNPNLRKSVAEYYLLLSSQYFRYKQTLKKSHLKNSLKEQYASWEDNIRKNLDYPFYRQGWEYVKNQMHLTGEFSQVINRLSQIEEKRDEKNIENKER